MEFNNYKNGKSSDVREFVGSFKEQDIDIKLGSPNFEVYDRSFKEQDIDIKVETLHFESHDNNYQDEKFDKEINDPEVEDSQGIIQESNIYLGNMKVSYNSQRHSIIFP